MYLQLADNGMDLQDNGMDLQEDEISPYIYVPGEGSQEGVYLREDYFDSLSDEQWNATMDYLDECNPGLSFGGRGKARRAIRRDDRTGRKDSRKEKRFGRGTDRRAQRYASKEARAGAPGSDAKNFALDLIDNVSGRVGGAGAPIDASFNQRWYDKPENLLIGGGLAAAALYFATKNK